MSKQFILICFAVIIFGLTLILQLVKIGRNPVALYWDELAIGIDAYSISQTGKDIHGNLWFQAIYPSYGDYKAPIAIWLVSLSVKLFGLFPWVVRLPFLLSFLISLVGIYFLFAELLAQIVASKKTYQLIIVGLVLCVTTPWYFHFSRIGFESGLSLLFVIWSLVFLFRGLKRNNWYLILASIAGGIGTYSYFSVRYILPLFILPVLLTHFKEIWQKKIWLVVAVIIYISLQVPLYKSPYFAVSNQYRLSAPNIISNTKLLEQSAQLIAKSGNSLWARIIYHRYWFAGRDLVSNWLAYYSPNFLFVSGDPNLRHHTGFGGELLLVSLPLVLLGLYNLVKHWQQPMAFAIFCWILVAPITAALVYEPNHASRSIYLLIPISLIYLAGIIQLRDINKKYFQWIVMGLLILISGNFYLYIEDYFRHYPVRSSQAWQLGNQYIGQIVAQNKNQYFKIFATSTYWKPALAVLFYNPEYIRIIQDQNAQSDNYAWLGQIGSIDFTQIINEKIDGKTLIITDSKNNWQGRELESYVFADGKPALYVFEKK